MTIFPFMAPKRLWSILKRSFTDFMDDNVLKLSSSLAFSTVFSLPGLLIIIIWFATMFYGREIIEGTIYNQIEGFVGTPAANSIQETMRSFMFANASKLATIIGFASLALLRCSVKFRIR